MANNQTGSLSNRAMLVTLSLSCWTARKHDRKVSDEVASNHQTSKQAGRYHKRLLPECSPSYDAVVSARNALRNAFYANTLPWGERDTRILSAAHFMDFSKIMRERKSDFEKAVSQFVQDYPTLQNDARQYLNGLYNAADYPNAAEVRDLFSSRVDILPLPSGKDFRVDLGDDVVKVIREEIERQSAESIDRSMQDAWSRLYDGVKAMVSRLSDPEAIYRDSLFTNLQELCDVLPKLNIAGDPALDRVAQQIKDEVLIVHADIARNDKKVRQQIANSADKIRRSMKARVKDASEPEIAVRTPKASKKSAGKTSAVKASGKKDAPKTASKSTKKAEQPAPAPSAADVAAQADAIAASMAGLMPSF